MGFTAGLMRFWLSAGRGGFTLSGSDTLGTEFYCIFYNGPDPERDPTKGWKVKPSPVPNKLGRFAEVKSVNYLQNAMNVMDAEDGGFDQGVFVRPDGTLCEGPNLNFAIIKDGVVRTPEFKECLAGCTMQRIIDLIPEYSAENLLEGVVDVQQVCPTPLYLTWRCLHELDSVAEIPRHTERSMACMMSAPWLQGSITVEDLSEAEEALMTGGSVPVMAVTQWDGRDIGDGEVGVQVLALRQMILNDMIPKKGSGQHTQIPYGMLTGMTEDM